MAAAQQSSRQAATRSHPLSRGGCVRFPWALSREAPVDPAAPAPPSLSHPVRVAYTDAGSTGGAPMTEEEWLAAGDSWDLLRFLKDEVFYGRTLSPRKRRLFSCACVRLIWSALDDERSRQVVEVAERYADRGATKA